MIKGLSLQLNEAGKIKIGKKGKMTTSKAGNEFRLPEKLDHFLITTTEKNEDGDFVEDLELTDCLKLTNESRKNQAGNLTGIPIRLLYNDPELNFPNRLVCYSKGIKVCEGDGETAKDRISDFKKDKPCPCSKFTDPKYQGDKCKAVGALKCLIDEASYLGQVHVFRTTSINSVKGILGGMELIKTITNGYLAGLPLMLMVDNKTTTIPATGQSTTVQVVSVCFRGSMEKLRQKALCQIKENSEFLIDVDKMEKEIKQISAPEIIPEAEEIDFQEEFFPDSAKNIVKKDVEAVEEVQETVEQVVEEKEIEPEQEEKKEQKLDEKEQKKLDLYNRFKACSDETEALKLLKRLELKFLYEYSRESFFPNEILTGTKKPRCLTVIGDFVGSARWMALFPELREAGTQEETKLVDESTIKDESDILATSDFLNELKTMRKQSDIVEAIRAYFDKPINGTLPPSELIKMAEKMVISEWKNAETENKESNNETKEALPEVTEEPEKKEEPEQEPVVGKEAKVNQAGKNDKLIGETELRQLANAKRLADISNELWKELIAENNFRNSDGNKLESAREFTIKQGELMLAIIKEHEEIPF